MALTLQSNISEISGVGGGYAKKLEKLGVKTVRDLLFYFPRRWDDFSKITSISQIKVGEQVSVRGKITEIGSKRSRKGAAVTEAIIQDETGTLKTVWFNQPFLEKTLKEGEEIFLAGKLEWSFGSVSMVSPAYEKINGELSELHHVARIVPVYPETEGLTSKWLRTKVASLAKLVYGIKDHLPVEVKDKNNLIELSASVRAMHFPENMAELERAKRRLTFDNLFCLLSAVLENRKEADREKAIAIDFDEELGKKFVKSLPYTLTDSQRKAAWEILQDLAKTTPMNRLLEGDVGSGKTVVAAMAALMVANRGYQTALVAPTEILANQHFLEIKKLLEVFKIKTALLTSSTSKAERTEVLKNIKEGEVQIIIGTHSLLSPEIKYWTLGLVIIDEQHRFGVEQRMILKQANVETKKMPHFLSMSATPIPRTLAITVFGDLDLSVLTEMPPGRKKVATHLVPPEKRAEGYKFIDEKIKEGRQVFVICPLVNVSDKLGVKSATEEAERLKKEVFAHRRVGLLHGKLKPVEKEKAMADFKAGKIDILVSTSVIEVGVDVPNASIMVIEGAERFGLAQLHQFRGRVGRGEHQSYCFLFASSWNEEIEKRLNALISSENGFDLAEKDLDLRGPGALLGVKQHGRIDETLTAAIRNPQLIAEVQKTAAEFLAKNNLSDFPLLSEKISAYQIAAKLE